VSASGADSGQEVVLVRHAETEWSRSGRHTGRTDLPLTAPGRALAGSLGGGLARWHFRLVLVSPARRARETCRLCGLDDHAVVREDLHEWDYGDYEGLTTAQVQRRRPGWSLWHDGCPGGESPQAIAARADGVIAALDAAAGPIAVFSHGHMLRVLGARWIGLAARQGAHLRLATGAICVLGYEHGERALASWSCTGSI
jgi:broad specificity phosphatase PhoE